MKLLALSLAFFLVLMALGSGVNAQVPLNSRCLDNSTLEIYTNVSLSGSITELRFGNQTCPNGCEEGIGKYGADCVEPDYMISIQIIIGIIAFLGFIIWAAGRKK